MTVTIYHNPRCSTSRKTLALLEGRGIRPTVVEYLKTPPDAATLRQWLKAMGIAPRALMRRKEPVYKDLGLDDPKMSEAALVAAMVANPILIERPVVVRGAKVALGRPPEAVLVLL
ncbi:MAG: arsenate reductase (glutaredoxin) [Alphaproteobacteria bacterium]|nr:arsenate reductase (glutaredoxin) [Alphaproteobacteria bacterium]